MSLKPKQLAIEPGWAPLHMMDQVSYMSEVLSYGDGSPAASESERDPEHVFWTKANGVFRPSDGLVADIEPGVYSANCDERGLYLRPVDWSGDEVLRFEHDTIDCLLLEIAKFWDKAANFAKYKMLQKRGILMIGPPASGKTTAIRAVAADVIARKGLVLVFDAQIKFWVDAIRAIRERNPDMPIVAVIEDIDAVMESSPEVENIILQVLDGAMTPDKTIFIATTNYAERLDQRVTCRPCRFDHRLEVPLPSVEGRKAYIRARLAPEDLEKIDIDQWVRDTDGMTYAHLREIIVAVMVLEQTYDSALARMRELDEAPASSDDLSRNSGKTKMNVFGGRQR